jgi:hypothetical protein
MDTSFVYIFPIIVVILECWFLRVCVRLKGNRKVPRILVASLILISFIPILGLILSALFIFIVAMLINGEDLEVVDNKFTRFWIND